MTDILKVYIKRRKDALDELDILLGYQIEAPNNGENNVKIEQTTRTIKEYEKKIKEIEEQNVLQDEEIEELRIFIITGTNNKIKEILDPEIFNLLIPPNHDDYQHKKWIPFTSENYVIEDLISQLKQKGFDFIEDYLQEQEIIKIIDSIENNPKMCIAIVDLLTIDDKNKEIAMRFNRRDIGGVITPICPFLDNKVKIYMQKKGKEVFNYLDYYVGNTWSDLYHPESSGRYSLLQTLQILIKKNYPMMNNIVDRSTAKLRSKMSSSI